MKIEQFDRRRLYWIMQCFGWGLFFIVYTTAAGFFIGFQWQTYASYVNAALFGLIFSHLYRWWIKKEQWDGYLKDYDGATLLQCEIHSEIDYTDTKGMLRRQKENIYRMLAEKLGAKVVHDGTKEGHRLDDPFDVPGVQSAGWTKEFVERIESEQRAITSLQSQLKSILDDLMNTKFVWPYLKEVDAEKYPEYRNVVKDPIDLNIIRARLESGVYYTTKRIFRDEIKLMCENCKLFNVNPLSQYHMTALKVEEFVMPRLAAIHI